MKEPSWNKLHEAKTEPVRNQTVRTYALGRPGNDLLSRALRRSTIGAKGLHGRVRDGIGCGPLAIATRSSKRIWMHSSVCCNNTDITHAHIYACKPKAVQSDNLVDEPCRCTRQLLNVCIGSRKILRKRPTIKPIEQLVLVSFTCCHASTPSLSTWWSSTALERNLVLRGASRLDAFSGYPFRT